MMNANGNPPSYQLYWSQTISNMCEEGNSAACGLPTESVDGSDEQCKTTHQLVQANDWAEEVGGWMGWEDEQRVLMMIILVGNSAGNIGSIDGWTDDNSLIHSGNCRNSIRIL